MKCFKSDKNLSINNVNVKTESDLKQLTAYNFYHN